VSADVVRTNGKIWLHKRCPDHGLEVVLESSNSNFYFIAPTSGSQCEPASDCCGPETVLPNEPAGPTCVALIEITDGCNLECPLCFASSAPGNRFQMSLTEFSSRIEKTIESRGKIDILMISGGEPTLHPKLNQMLALASAEPNIGRILMNTNGLLLHRSERVAQALLDHRKKLEVYLQFDSLVQNTVQTLRGDASIISEKQLALDWLEQHDLPTTLAVTMRRNTSVEELRDVIRIAFDRKNIRGCTFQPAFASGRHAAPFDPQDRLTTPDAVELICNACPDLFEHSAFTNLPCSHPNCAIVAYYYRDGNRLWPLTSDIAPDDSIRDRINFDIDDLKNACGCETTELGQYISRAELSPENSFRVVVKPFMDRFNLNKDRSRQCCTHVVGPGGKLMSFCEYNVHRERLEWDVNSADQLSCDPSTGCC